MEKGNEFSVCTVIRGNYTGKGKQVLAGAPTVRLSSALFSGCRTHDNYRRYAISAECGLGIKNQQADICAFCVGKSALRD